MLRIRSTFFRTTGAFMVAATVLSADVFAAPAGSGGGGGWWSSWWGSNNHEGGAWGDGGWAGGGGQGGPADTPEINPALIGGAITLLLGGALILTDMLRNKKACASN